MQKEIIDNKQNHNGLFYVIKKDFFSIPVSIRIMSFSLFIFMLGRGLGADTFFSVYVKTIVDNVFLVSVIGSILAISKMIFSIPVGDLDDRGDIRYILFTGKVLYILCGFLYFFAGIFGSLIVLIIAVIINGFATATSFTTYQSYIREHSNKHNRCSVFGLMFSSMNLAYVIGAILASLMIVWIDLPYLFLFIVLSSIASILTDRLFHIELKHKKIKHIFKKESFLHQFLSEIFSLDGYKRIFEDIKGYGKKMYQALGIQFFLNVLNYIGFLFIPIVAIKNDLSLSQIAIVFAVMRVPYVLNFFTAEIADKYNKKTFMGIIFIFLAILFSLIAYSDNFGNILILSFGIALGVAMASPIIEGLVSDYIHPNDGGAITGVSQFVGRLGDIVGSIGFGILISIVGMKSGFIRAGVLTFIVGIALITRKLFRQKIGVKLKK
ncbi:MAG: MFS transporter [Candidatus Absconditicoccaceae bacterium]